MEDLCGEMMFFMQLLVNVGCQLSRHLDIVLLQLEHLQLKDQEGLKVLILLV